MMHNNELVSLAFRALESSYSPYSNFPVGAALLCDDGQVFLGCNIENASYGLSNCAERTAIFHAVSKGKKDGFLALAIAGLGADYCWPCGACRQVINEFAPDIRILVARGDKTFVETTLDALLPHAFGPKSLD